MTAPRLLAALGALLLALCLAGSAGSATTATNRQAAEQDAAALLARFAAPAGVRPLQSIPPKAGSWLRSKYLIPAHVADRHRLWRIAASEHSIVAFVRAHEPRGAKLRTDNSTSASPHALRSHHFVFSFPAKPGRIWSRELFVAVVPLRKDVTAVRVDAQDAWVWTQTAHERLPDGVRRIDITRPHWAKHPAFSLHVTHVAKIRRIVGWVRALAVVPPRTGCAVEGMIAGPLLTLSFRGRGGTLLARIGLRGYGAGPTPACRAIAYTVRGRALALDGGTFPRRLEGLVGVSVY